MNMCLHYAPALAYYYSSKQVLSASYDCVPTVENFP